MTDTIKFLLKVLFIIFIIIPCGICLAGNMLRSDMLEPIPPTPVVPSTLYFETIPPDVHLLAHQRFVKTGETVFVFEGEEMYCAAASDGNTCPTTNNVLAVMACDDTLTDYSVDYVKGRYVVSVENFTLCTLDDNFSTIEGK